MIEKETKLHRSTLQMGTGSFGGSQVRERHTQFAEKLNNIFNDF